mgnify:CR=1 FL=1
MSVLNIEKMNIEELIQIYNDLKEHKQIFANIDVEFFFEFVDKLIKAYRDLEANNVNKLIDDTKCLRCGSGTPAYCEDCMQAVIAENAKLQAKNTELKEERDSIYNDYQDLGKEKCMNGMVMEEKVKAIKKLADEIFDIC